MRYFVSNAIVQYDYNEGSEDINVIYVNFIYININYKICYLFHIIICIYIMQTKCIFNKNAKKE